METKRNESDKLTIQFEVLRQISDFTIKELGHFLNSCLFVLNKSLTQFLSHDIRHKGHIKINKIRLSSSF